MTQLILTFFIGLLTGMIAGAAVFALLAMSRHNMDDK